MTAIKIEPYSREYHQHLYMQRRQILKLFLPITLLAAGVVGAVAARKLLLNPDCPRLDSPALLSRLQAFSDVELGKKVAPEIATYGQDRLRALCQQGFDQRYRQLVQDDFAGQRTQKIDGWILSQTEALTHLVVSQPAMLSDVPPAGG